MRARPLLLFIGAVTLVAASCAIFDSTFNNFLSDTFGLSPGARGWLELPREVPGVLVVLMAGILCMLPITRLGMVGAGAMAAGMAGMALFGFHFWPMIAMMILASAGLHLTMPVMDTIAMSVCEPGRRGRSLGRLGAASTLGVILGCGFVFLAVRGVRPSYRTGFVTSTALAIVGAFLYSRMSLPHLHQPRARLVFRRQYWLYYALEFLAGARKQIFLTFGPWALIKIYGRPAEGIALLMLIGAAGGLIFKPLTGWAIDHLGERTILVAEGFLLVIVCLGYGYALRMMGGDARRALPLACACYVADNLLFALGTARSVYISRVARSVGDLSSTLAMGLSINHVASMTIPIVAGAIWEWLGYERLFLAAAALALAIGALGFLIPTKRPHTALAP